MEILSRVMEIAALRIFMDLQGRYFYFGTRSFICQGTSTSRQRRNLFGLRVKLPLVSVCLIAHCPSKFAAL